METQDGRWTQSKETLWLQPVLNLLDDFIKLTKPIPGFLFGSFGWIGDQLNFKSPAMAFRFEVHFGFTYA